MSGWGVAAGAASQALGPAISSTASAFMAKRQRRHEQLMADQQYDRMKKERDYMNWYNSPIEQMKRFKEAGLNPNLIYGQGSAGEQRSAVRPERPGSKFGDIHPINIDPLGELGKYQDWQQKKAQTDNITADTFGKQLMNDILDQTKQQRIDSQIADLEYKQNRAKTEAQRIEISKQIVGLTNAKWRYQNSVNRFAKDGIFPGDNVWLRQGFNVFGQAMKNFFNDFKQKIYKGNPNWVGFDYITKP